MPLGKDGTYRPQHMVGCATTMTTPSFNYLLWELTNATIRTETFNGGYGYGYGYSESYGYHGVCYGEIYGGGYGRCGNGYSYGYGRHSDGAGFGCGPGYNI